MTDSAIGQYPLNRRSILRASALGMGVLAVGGTPFAGTVRGDHVDGHAASEFSLYGIDHMSSPNRLVQIDAQDLVPGGGSITVDSIPLVGGPVSVNTLAAHPFEDGGARWFYSTDQTTNKAFRVHPTTGQVQFLGDANPVLGGIAGSAIIVDDNDDARWYGITHGGASPASTLFEIDLTDGSTDEKGALHDVENDESTAVVATHLGLGVNFLTDELWGVLGDPADATNSRVFRVVDVETGEVEIVDSEAMTGGRSVGAALGPCANVMYAVRKGNEIFGYDVAAEEEFSYGTLAYESGTLDFDSLAVPYGFECQACDPCAFDGTYKFEYIYDDEDELDGFYLEDGDGFAGIEYDSYESKAGEAYEPITVSFDADICADQLAATVKAGRTTDVVEVTSTGDGTFEVTIDFEGSPFANQRNGKLFAISYIEFECVDAA